MKKFYISLVFVLIFSLSDAFSQSVSINTDGSNADASSILDVKATDKGVLVPRVSLTDVTSASPVSSPASGLLVYNTNATVTGGHGVGFYVWNGTSWIKLVQDNDGAFIRNQNTTDQTANFRITGIGRANTSFQSPIYTRADAGTVAIRPHTDATNAIQLQNAAGTSILNVDATNQRVGIGTTTPSQKLDVQGGNARINNTFIGDVGHSATWGGFSHSSQNTTTGYALLQSSDGAFTLLNKLNTGSGYIGFRVSNTDMAVITNAGDMGVGTTTPAERIHSTGNIRADGIVYWGNLLSRTETRDNAGLQGNAGARSGFFETSAPSPAANWYPGATSWQHLIDIRHSNPNNNYAMQFAGSFFDQRLFFRKTNNNPSQAWTEVATIGRGNGGMISYVKQESFSSTIKNNWVAVTGYSPWMRVNDGDQIKLDGMYYGRLTGGSGDEYWYTVIEITGQNGCPAQQFSNIHDYWHPTEAANDHDNFKPVVYMDVWPSNCTGEIRFRKWIYMQGDDNWQAREIIITGTRY